MKKFILFLLIGFTAIAILTPINKANAQSQYLRVIDDNTPFYTNEFSSSPLFYLPYSYYVKVIGENGDFYHVEYCGENGINGLDGFVPKTKLFDDSQSSSSYYPNVTITTSSNAVLYADSSLLNSIQYIFPDREVKYYGSLYQADNTLIYFVSYNDKLGYIKESALLPFEIPLHPNPLTFLDTPEEPEETPETPEIKPSADVSSIKIAIIVSLSFAGLFAIFIAFKNKPTKSNSSYYEETDYE
ncbi:MAG: hypothetical protein IJW43_01520 [Clostridia bacterium]|nr:hypothetical protein [Clostridia bacterium]